MASVKVAVRVRPINKRYTLWFTDVTHFWVVLKNADDADNADERGQQ